jgi:hypothetical protein
MHGSAYCGELSILRAYSFDEAMTINLTPISKKKKSSKSMSLHIKDADGTEIPETPLLYVTLHGGMEGIGEFTDDGDGPRRTGQMTLFVSVHGLLEDEQGDDDGEGRVKPS